MYILEGNIGAGKTTFLKLIAQKTAGISVSYEPLDDWQKRVSGRSLLESFYTDPHRWAYSMETFAMLSRVREHLRDQERVDPHGIIERSVYSGFYCFALNSYRNNFLTPLEWHMCKTWFDFLIPGKCRPPHGFIYLRVNPTVAYERIVKRGRTAESGITLDYLEQLHQCHEAFLIKKEGVLRELQCVPVLTVDADQDFENNGTRLEVILDTVKNFINTVTPFDKSK